MASEVKAVDNKLYDEDGNALPDAAAPEAAPGSATAELNKNRAQTNLFILCIEKQDIPMKTVVETVRLNIKAKLIFIDFEGLSDGDSVKKILANIKPRNLVSNRPPL